MDIVKKMWAAYCEAAGGVTYDGKPLPTWEELGEDRQKCWMAAGKEAADEIERLRQQNADLVEELWGIALHSGSREARFQLITAIAKATGGE